MYLSQLDEFINEMYETEIQQGYLSKLENVATEINQ
jgi:hypothetical protein